MARGPINLALDHKALVRERDRMIGRMARAVTDTMRETSDDVRDDWREQIRSARLGDRLPNSIRSRAYPERGRGSLNPTGIVYARPAKNGRGAAAIIEGYNYGARIQARKGRFLAIPSDDCPRKPGGRALTPEEVEDRFGKGLIFIPAGARGFRSPSRRTNAVGFLVIRGLVVNKAAQRYRRPSKREAEGRTRNPRELQTIIMFSLVRQVTVEKRLDLMDAAEQGMSRFGGKLLRRLGTGR